MTLLQAVTIASTTFKNTIVMKGWRAPKHMNRRVSRLEYNTARGNTIKYECEKCENQFIVRLNSYKFAGFVKKSKKSLNGSYKKLFYI